MQNRKKTRNQDLHELIKTEVERIAVKLTNVRVDHGTWYFSFSFTGESSLVKIFRHDGQKQDGWFGPFSNYTIAKNSALVWTRGLVRQVVDHRK
jgi:hypothetical protein